MTSKFNQRWLIGGVIWMVAIIMTYWNFNLIWQVGNMRQNSERLRREVSFQHRHADKLQQIQEMSTSQYKSVASKTLGFESVRSSLNALAALLGLNDVKIEGLLGKATERRLPIKIRMLGDYQKATGFVSALLKYPYLSIKHSRIVMMNAKGQTEIEFEVDFHFKLAPQQTDKPRPLQAVATSASQGVLTQ